MKRFTHIVAIIFIIIGCDSKNKKETMLDEVSISANEMNPKLLKKEIFEDSNFKSFILFCTFYDGKIMDSEYLEMSKHLYLKHNDPSILNDIFLAYLYKYNPEVPYMTGDIKIMIKKVPSRDLIVALNYLQIGVDRGSIRCIESMIEYYSGIENHKKKLELENYLEKVVNKQREESP